MMKILNITILLLSLFITGCNKETTILTGTIKTYSEGNPSETLSIYSSNIEINKKNNTIKISKAVGTINNNIIKVNGNILTDKYLLNGTLVAVRQKNKIHGFWQGTIHRYNSKWGLFAEGEITIKGVKL